ncbi:hypothetical protein FPQ18DRAFT_302218 [Pyronema domesticum]|nr:hypothetical protein FPQ18DRAFT_302218 [Pyronema domesticum]
MIIQMQVEHSHFKAFLHRFNLIDDPYYDCGDPYVPVQSMEHILCHCPHFMAHHLDAMDAIPITFKSSLFLYLDKAMDQLVRLIRDRKMALWNGEVEGPGRFGEERPEGCLGKEEDEEEEGDEEWERDRVEEWRLGWPDERGEEEGINGEDEAGNVVAEEEN